MFRGDIMPTIEFVNVTKRFLKDKLIKNLNLVIEDGSYTVLCGPTGSGKTTILLMIAGIVKPDKGEIYIDGVLVNDIPPEDRNVGIVFETYALFPHMNVIRNVTYGPWVRGYDLELAIKNGREILDMLYLSGWEDAYPHELSGGMKQRVALARAIASNSKILLLDEPLGALDAKIRAELRYELRELVKSLNLTAVHATHDIEEAMLIADKIVILNNGIVEQVGTPEEIYENPKSIFVANYVTEGNFLEGIIKSIENTHYIIELRNGDVLRANKNTQARYSINDHVICFIRSEDISIKKMTKNGNKQLKSNSFEGKIIDISFSGSFTRIEVAIEDWERPIVVRELGDIVDQYDEKEKVIVHFPDDRVRLYKYPSGKKFADILLI